MATCLSPPGAWARSMWLPAVQAALQVSAFKSDGTDPTRSEGDKNFDVEVLVHMAH